MHSNHCAHKLLPWFDGMLAADEDYFKQHGEPLFSSHMLDLSEEPKDENIATCVKYFSRMAPLGLWLEMEIGITGGEEDGVDNSSVDNSKLYTQPEDIWDVYSALSEISPNFSIAAAFGNVHGVYKPGNVRLHPELLNKHQIYAEEKLAGKQKKPLFLVFHGGSGSTKDEIKTAVSNGVVKMNVDTDTQWAYLSGVRVSLPQHPPYGTTILLSPGPQCASAGANVVLSSAGLCADQVGLPPDPGREPGRCRQAQQEGKPVFRAFRTHLMNITTHTPSRAQYYDPRVWVREGEKTLVVRVKEACADLGNIGQSPISPRPAPQPTDGWRCPQTSSDRCMRGVRRACRRGSDERARDEHSRNTHNALYLYRAPLVGRHHVKPSVCAITLYAPRGSRVWGVRVARAQECTSAQAHPRSHKYINGLIHDAAAQDRGARGKGGGGGLGAIQRAGGLSSSPSLSGTAGSELLSRGDERGRRRKG